MENLMADVDVSIKLQELEIQSALQAQQSEVHEKLLAQNTETLKQVKDVLIDNAVMAQNISHLSARVDDVVDQVKDNHTKITYWSGGLATIILFSGIVFTAFKLQPVQQSSHDGRSDLRAEPHQRQELQRSTK